MAESSPMNPYLSYMALQDPASSMRYQMQQALAQQMMQSGMEGDGNPAQTVGSGTMERTVRLNPLTGLANAGKTMLGAKMQANNMAKLGAMMGDKPDIAAATNAAIGPDGEGPATAQAVAAQLGKQMQGPTSGLPSVTGDPMKDWLLSQSNPELFKAIAARTQPTDIQKNLSSPQSAGYVPIPMVKTPSGIDAPQSTYMQQFGGGQPPAPAPQAAIPPTAPINPASPLDAPSSPQREANAASALQGGAADGRLDFSQTPPPAPSAAPPPNPADPANFMNPAFGKGESENAVKNADNLSDAQKTYNVAASALPRALERFDQLRKAAPQASYGPESLINQEGEGLGPDFARTGMGKYFEPDTATANQTIQQASKQGILTELGPQLAGLRGNKFLESIASGASGLNAADPPDTKINAINGLESQYVANLKSLAAQRRNYGDNSAPTDAEIDAMVAKARGGSASMPSAPKIIKYNANGERQ